MLIAVFLAVLASAFLVGLGLRAHGIHWFVAWLLASLVVPSAVYADDIISPTGWLGMALVVGALWSVALGGLGVFFGWLIVRKRSGGPTSQSNATRDERPNP
jgi:hypothetical protein